MRYVAEGVVDRYQEAQRAQFSVIGDAELQVLKGEDGALEK